MGKVGAIPAAARQDAVCHLLRRPTLEKGLSSYGSRRSQELVADWYVTPRPPSFVSRRRECWSACFRSCWLEPIGGLLSMVPAGADLPVTLAVDEVPPVSIRTSCDDQNVLDAPSKTGRVRPGNPSQLATLILDPMADGVSLHIAPRA